MRLLLGFICGWILLRIMRSVIAAQLQTQEKDTAVGKQPKHKALDLAPCPKCGVYTALPCGNPDCGTK